MSQDEFNRLPALLDYSEARRVLGLGDRGFRALVEKRPRIRRRLPGMKRCKYVKAEIAALLSMEYR